MSIPSKDINIQNRFIMVYKVLRFIWVYPLYIWFISWITFPKNEALFPSFIGEVGAEFPFDFAAADACFWSSCCCNICDFTSKSPGGTLAPSVGPAASDAGVWSPLWYLKQDIERIELQFQNCILRNTHTLSIYGSYYYPCQQIVLDLIRNVYW